MSRPLESLRVALTSFALPLLIAGIPIVVIGWVWIRAMR